MKRTVRYHISRANMNYMMSYAVIMQLYHAMIIRIKSGEPGFPGIPCPEGLVESFVSPKAQPEGLLRLHQA